MDFWQAMTLYEKNTPKNSELSQFTICMEFLDSGHVYKLPFLLIDFTISPDGCWCTLLSYKKLQFVSFSDTKVLFKHEVIKPKCVPHRL